MEQDPLRCTPRTEWPRLMELFKADWPRGIAGYYTLDVQQKWFQLGLDYGFRVYCPFGDKRNGMVAINEKKSFYEVIIQCPSDDTSKLEEALCRTKVIDWTKSVIIPFSPDHIINAIKRNLVHLPVELDFILPSGSFVYYKDRPPFDVRLTPNVRFGFLSIEHVPMINYNWAHCYPTSEWYFEQLIRANSGFGLYVDDVLVSWVFIYEVGTVGHLYTIEEHRRKGYGETLLKLIANELLRRNEDVFAFSVNGNIRSCNLLEKVGFVNYGRSSWCYLNPKMDL